LCSAPIVGTRPESSRAPRNRRRKPPSEASSTARTVPHRRASVRLGGASICPRVQVPFPPGGYRAATQEIAGFGVFWSIKGGSNLGDALGANEYSGVRAPDKGGGPDPRFRRLPGGSTYGGLAARPGQPLGRRRRTASPIQPPRVGRVDHGSSPDPPLAVRRPCFQPRRASYTRRRPSSSKQTARRSVRRPSIGRLARAHAAPQPARLLPAPIPPELLRPGPSDK